MVYISFPIVRAPQGLVRLWKMLLLVLRFISLQRFFNAAMTELLDTSCKNMVVNRGYTDPSIIPPDIDAIRVKSTILHISRKKDGTITGNGATKPTIFTPITPNTRSIPWKRQLRQASVVEAPTKHPKP